MLVKSVFLPYYSNNMDALQKNAFDRLVAGLSAEERTNMLLRLNSPDMKEVNLTNNSRSVDDFEGTLVLRLKQESPLYRFYLWLKSLFSKEPVQKIYNDDVLTSLARKINKEHPGLINVHGQVLDSLFYEQLTSLKAVSDFFKPYFKYIEENMGAFYVFLSSFVAPQIGDKINAKADPYNLELEKEPTNELRNSLLRTLDDILKDFPEAAKENMYSAVKSVQWLQAFTNLPFIHFIAQFTDITDNSFTCPYTSAKVDYDVFSSVLSNHVPLPNEVLEAIFLFSQKDDLKPDLLDADVENSVKKFMSVAAQNLSQIKLFMSVIPVTTMGKIIFSDYDWIPGTHGGSEDWFSKFRLHWRKIFDIRWTSYIRDRKKTILSDKLKNDFGLDSFPEMPIKPWENLWGGIQFGYELTGGFLAWYCESKYAENQASLNTVIMEGVFMKNDNRTEFSESLSTFFQAADRMNDLIRKIDVKDEYGLAFADLENGSSRNFKSQQRLDSMMMSIESEVREIAEDFIRSIKIMEIVFKGIFNEISDGMHASLQNLNTLKGHGKTRFKDELMSTRHDLNQLAYYLIEFTPIDAPTR